MIAQSAYVVGAGGHERVVLDLLLACGFSVLGISDPNMRPVQTAFGVPVLERDEVIDDLDTLVSVLANGVGVDPSVGARTSLFRAMRDKGFGFPGIRHPSVSIAHECMPADGSQLIEGVIVQCRVTVGENTVINTDAIIDHHCQIGAHSFVAPGGTLCASVCIGEGVFIGAGTVVMPGIDIGSGSIVEGGAIVMRHVSEGRFVAGNPAAEIGTAQ